MVLLFPSLASGETVKWGDLIVREGLHYKKFTDVPFTGKITGEFQGKLKNGKKEGPWVSYHENGQLLSKFNYKNGKMEGPWVSHHDNGQIGSEGDFKNGKPDGPWVYYHKNGQLETKATYKNGKEEGPYESHNDNGQL